MLALKPFCLAPRLRALVPRAARTATFVVQATLITLGLIGAGELMEFLPVWLHGLVSGRSVKNEGLNRGGAETQSETINFQFSVPLCLGGENSEKFSEPPMA